MHAWAGRIRDHQVPRDEAFPSGPISIVCDTWDFFNVITKVLPALKDEIMAREGGPVVVRPDSGDPGRHHLRHVEVEPRGGGY